MDLWRGPGEGSVLKCLVWMAGGMDGLGLECAPSVKALTHDQIKEIW